MYVESNRKPGSKSRFLGRLHISTSCLAYGATKMPFWAVFLPVWPPGGRSPKLATALCRPLGAEDFCFSLVRIGPHLGEISKFERDKISHFGDSLAYIHSVSSLYVLSYTTYHRDIN